MNLPEGFQLSQSSLQDFVDCRRRFLLRYIQGLAWPAIVTEPVLENEHYLRQGELFHQMAHQYWVGVPAEQLSALTHDEELQRWWENFILSIPVLKGDHDLLAISSEVILSSPFGGYRLEAKYDLLRVSSQGEATILDWKTSRKRSKREWLANRLQTRVYPYLLARSGAQFNQGRPILPEQIEMVYWFADFPEQPERFAYSDRQFQDDELYLLGLVAEIQRLEENDFLMTDQSERCGYCVYRSLCDRGVEAAALDEMGGDWVGGERGISLDFEQIAEIEY
jgi:CRISPR/Cas system-associated exonuclease Cas4 (RecB family)